MRIAIVGVDYAPDVAGIAPYTTGLAEALARSGHHVSVVTTYAHYPRYRWSAEARPRFPWRRESRNGVDVIRVWTLLPPTRGAVGRVLFDSVFALAALIGALLFVRRPDAVISVCVPAQAGITGGLLARAFRARSILWIQDLPVEAALASGLVAPRSMIARIGRHTESAACRLNQTSVVITERFRAYVEAAGARTVVLPNWAPDERQRSAEPRKELRRRLGLPSDAFVLLHAGNVGHKQGLALFFSHLADSCPAGLHVVIVGGGGAEERVRAAAQASGCSHEFRDFVAAEELMPVLEAADALLLSQAPDVVDSVLPSKLLTYMRSGRPVFAAVNSASAAADVVMAAGCGVIADPADPAAVREALTGLIRAGEDELAELGAKGRAYVGRHFDRTVVLERWQEIVEPPGRPAAS